MIRKSLLIGLLVVALVLLIDGRVPKRYCDLALDLEWAGAGDRVDQDRNSIRPTADEAKRLRRTIRICELFTSQINLWNPLDGDFSLWREIPYWGDISLINVAVELDDVAFLDELVKEGHSIDGLPNSLGITTLYTATYRQAGSVFLWALSNGVDPNLTDTEGFSPLMLAAGMSQDGFQGLKPLIAAGAEIDAVSSDQWSPLAIAIRSGQFDNALILVDSGADTALAKSLIMDKARTVPSEDARKEILALLGEFEALVE